MLIYCSWIFQVPCQIENQTNAIGRYVSAPLLGRVELSRGGGVLFLWGPGRLGMFGGCWEEEEGENQVESASLHNLFEISEVAFVVYLPAWSLTSRPWNVTFRKESLSSLPTILLQGLCKTLGVYWVDIWWWCKMELMKCWGYNGTSTKWNDVWWVMFYLLPSYSPPFWERCRHFFERT